MSNDREALIRYARAKDRVQTDFVNPIIELIEATTNIVAENRLAAKQAAGASVQLQELWDALGVSTQADALDEIKRLRDQ